jgi:hypothetical protein
MEFQTQCRRYKQFLSGAHWCGAKLQKITECADGCPFNKVQQYETKTYTDRFGKEFTIRKKVEETE